MADEQSTQGDAQIEVEQKDGSAHIRVFNSASTASISDLRPATPNGPTGPSAVPTASPIGPTRTSGGRVELPFQPAAAQQVPLSARTQIGLTGASAIGVASSLRADATLTQGPASIGRTTIANRDAILLQSASIQLLLRDAIDRAKLERVNNGNLPELETILVSVEELHQTLLTSTAPVALGEKAISFKAALLNLWNRNHEEILKSSFYMGLFTAGLGLCAHFGLISALTVTTLIRGKDMAEALKQAVKLLEVMKQ